MPVLGFCLPHEQFPVPQLIENAAAAVDAGFDALWTSDHFHPWQHNQGHAGHAWITLAALAFASLAVLYPGRVYLGVGTGEALNEKAAGGGWGPYRERAARLVEAIGIIRRLWTGEWVDHGGRYFELHSAHL